MKPTVTSTVLSDLRPSKYWQTSLINSPNALQELFNHFISQVIIGGFIIRLTELKESAGFCVIVEQPFLFSLLFSFDDAKDETSA